jgi:hypothetical protein
MPATATILKDSGPTNTRNVTVQFDDENGLINVAHVRLSAGIDAQTWADVAAARKYDGVRRREMEIAIDRCIGGEDPATIPLVRIARPELWKRMTRRLHNAPRNGLDADTMRGLAQWVVNRATPAIRADLNNVRTNAEVNALKTQWTALLTSVDEFDDVEEEV